MPDHTKGPWSYGLEDYDDWGIARVPAGFIICQARAPVTEEEKSQCRVNGTDPYEANARLIAAALELLEALDNLAIAIGMGWDLHGVLNVARTAIAKARETE